MDGVDDYLLTAKVVYDAILIDFVPLNITSPTRQISYLIESNQSQGWYAYRKTDNSDSRDGYSYLYSIWDGGSSEGYGWNKVVQDNMRQTLRVVVNADHSSGTDTRDNSVRICYPGTGQGYLSAEIYSVKLTLKGTVVAHYDTSTGTVQDQSGNGNHATLFGGTWVEEEGGDGGTEPQTHALSLSDSIITNDTITKRFSVIVLDAISANETNRETTQKITNDSILILEQITKQFEKDFSDNLDLNETFSTFGGKSILLTDSLNITDNISTTKQLSRFLSEVVNISDDLNKSASQNITLFDVIVTNDNVNLFNPNAPNLIGVINLQGKRDLFVYIQGKRELVVFMEGGLTMIPNQNFNMVSGDTKRLVIDIKEDIAGASVKWVLFKSGEPEITLIKEGNVIDGKINITLEKGDTEDLNGIYKHECELTDQQGNISTVTSGTVIIIKDAI